ncbi:MAG TPA: helix-turn-helix transcriptional regulator [Bacteroidota bacterium]
MGTPKNRRSRKSTTTLYIKNMVCNRCIRVVREELEKLGLNIQRVDLGEVDLSEVKNLNLRKVQEVLKLNGFELIEDKRVRIIERIKLAILRLVQRDQSIDPMKLNLSEYIAGELGHDYHYLSSLFSSIENVTIEQYFILQKIERAKELLKYGELTLSEIAFNMGYSSVQHLSNQFKNITGLTPSYFKGMKKSIRRPLDKVGTL